MITDENKSYKENMGAKTKIIISIPLYIIVYNILGWTLGGAGPVGPYKEFVLDPVDLVWIGIGLGLQAFIFYILYFEHKHTKNINLWFILATLLFTMPLIILTQTYLFWTLPEIYFFLSFGFWGFLLAIGIYRAYKIEKRLEVYDQ